MIRSALSILALSLIASSAYAGPDPQKCDAAVETAGLKAVNKKWPGDSVETRSVTGHRLLLNGDWIETYVLGISDEVDPSDWVLILDKKTCKVKALINSTDSSSEFPYRG